MASDGLDSIPSSSSPTISPSLDRPCPTLLKLSQKPLDPLVSRTHPSDNISLPSPPFPASTLTADTHPPDSILLANSTHDYYPVEHDGSSSDLPFHPHGRRRTGGIGTVSESSIGSSSTEYDAEDNSSPLHPSPLHPVHSDVTTLPTLTQHTTPDAGSRPLFGVVTHFLQVVILERIGVRRPPLSPSRETDTGSDTTQNDGQKGDGVDVKCKGAEPHPTANESPASELVLPPEYMDSSRLIRPSRPPSPFPPIPAKSQGSQSRVLVLFSICAAVATVTVASFKFRIFRYFGMTRLKGILR